MKNINHWFARNLLVVVVAAFLPALATEGALACLGPYRSPDWQVANAPLIFVGRVEKVEEVKMPEGPSSPPGFEEGDKHTVAQVKITSVLKGKVDGKTIKVHSGPIESCDDCEVHFTFKVGETRIFLPDSIDEKGEAHLRWGGSLLSMQDFELIESCWNRAKLFKAQYIASLKKEYPEEFEKAQVLEKKITDMSKKWSLEIVKVEGFPEFGIGSVDKNLKKVIEDKSVVVLHICVALNWLSTGSDSWSYHETWAVTLQEVVTGNKLEKKFADFERKRIRREMKERDFQEKRIENYLECFDDNNFGSPLVFPPCAPGSYGPKKPFNRETLTTDFLYRYACYNRGNMFVAYGMQFDILRKLDPVEAGTVLEAMYGSRDERLSLVAYRAIEQIPGTRLVDIIASDMIDDNPDAWRCLTSEQSEKAGNERLKALIQSAKESLSEYGFAYFWLTLKEGECFKKVCLGSAVDWLEKTEKEDGVKGWEKNDINLLKEYLQEYLNAALRHHGANGIEKPTAAEYRKWLKTLKEEQNNARE